MKWSDRVSKCTKQAKHVGVFDRRGRGVVDVSLGTGGFAILEVVIASAIALIIIMGMATAISTLNKDATGVRFRTEADNFSEEVRTLLSNPQACLNSLGPQLVSTTTPNAIYYLSALKDKEVVANTVYAAGASYGGSTNSPALRLDKIIFTDLKPQASANTPVMTLQLMIADPKSGSGAQLVHRDIFIDLRLDATNTTILECAALSRMSDGIWSKTPVATLNSIFYHSVPIVGAGVGIGTDAPSAALHIVQNSTKGILLESVMASNSGNVDFWFKDGVAAHSNSMWDLSVTATSGEFALYNGNGATPLQIRIPSSSGNPRALFVDQYSNVGIGFNSLPPAGLQSALQVKGSITLSGAGTVGTALLPWDNVYGWNITNLSDRRKKKEIEPSELGLKFVSQLNPVTYLWKNGPDSDRHFGLIAQEVEEQIRKSLNLHQGEPIPIVEHNLKTDSYGIRYFELISPIIASVKELLAISEKQTTRVQQLEDRLNAVVVENANMKSYFCSTDPNAPFCSQKSSIPVQSQTLDNLQNGSR